MRDIPVVAVVTGASRGAGQGIATALGQHGCIVYVTGRSERPGDASLPGTIHETAEAVTAAGGRGIAVRLDHRDDAQIAALFDQVRNEQGHIDILVNNVAAIHDELTMPGRFWEKPLKLADIIDVGIRSSYVASYHAAPMMVGRGKGLILFTSGSGAAHYVYGPGYGAHKASQDKMAADMAIDLHDTGVSALSIWMGALRTGRLLQLIASDPAKYRYLEDMVETPEFTGHLIWALSQDPALATLSGQTFIGAELARRYGLTDAGGRLPPSYRDSYGVAPLPQYDRIIR
ncbi:SDR family NAD(P)-dependent oxidoreductase [Sphingobium sp. AP49]|uniref:SDR family NAD(P)-dependent oxidoreductase n=1 Tax=Sphingobium sp. AP49 TaxID=1144307 RepID=UPI00026EE38E|nr:SDR family NAD(P)-dependent oxidoreductase [Sphingobium sp. AP49]WHO41032.1 SDR family NAD(P)-dependent oxidoreductase [Sphingobium sp. AP49]